MVPEPARQDASDKPDQCGSKHRAGGSSNILEGDGDLVDLDANG